MKTSITKKVRNKKHEKADQERAMILLEVEKKAGEQLIISEQGSLTAENEIKTLLYGNIDDPEKKYEVYYHIITRLLKRYLAVGEKNKKFREIVYEEKNVYLTRGKRKNEFGIRGADSRMGFISDAKEISDAVIKWVVSNGTQVELYAIFRSMNEKKGYSLS